jgi:hypothetical protein
MINEYGAVRGMRIGRGKGENGRILLPVTLYPGIESEREAGFNILVYAKRASQILMFIRVNRYAIYKIIQRFIPQIGF